jgi:Xaa-Pro aminopeptidase
MDRVRQRMRDLGVEVLRLDDMKDIFYLTGFETAGTCPTSLVVTQDVARLYTRKLELTNPVAGVELVGYDEFEEVRDAIQGERSSIVEAMRVVKSEEDLTAMREAARVLKLGIAALRIAEGTKECEIAADFAFATLKNGGEYSSYPPFVAADKNSLRAHHAPGKTAVKKLVFLELAACVHRRHVAKMLTVHLAPEPEWFKSARGAVLAALWRGREALRVGAKTRDVDSAMRGDLAASYPEAYLSSRFGYSIGISFYGDWSESNFLEVSPFSEHCVPENCVVHLIPWIMIPSLGTVGFSDVFHVTSDGVESLFTSESDESISNI